MTDNTPLIRFNPSKGGYYRDDSPTKPTGATGSRKEFKRILDKDDGGEGEGEATKKKLGAKKSGDLEEGDEIAIADEVVQTQLPQPPASLFDLSKSSVAKAPKAPKTVPAQPEPPSDPLGGLAAQTLESPGKVYGKMAKGKQFTLDDSVKAPAPKEPTTAPEKPVVDVNTVGIKDVPREDLIAAREDLPVKKDSSNGQFSREQPDLSTVNPLGINLQATPISAAEVKTDRPMPAQSLQSLVDQLVKEMSVMKVDGKSETTLVLKHPPILEGSRIVVTSFDSARGQFNIQFENLTQAAQHILDQQQNRTDLLLALEKKGYNIHILTTTTLDENRILTSNVDQTRQDQGQRRDEEGQEEDQRERPRDDEERNR